MTTVAQVRPTYAVEHIDGAWCVVNTTTHHIVRDWDDQKDLAEHECMLLNAKYFYRYEEES